MFVCCAIARNGVYMRYKERCILQYNVSVYAYSTLVVYMVHCTRVMRVRLREAVTLPHVCCIMLLHGCNTLYDMSSVHGLRNAHVYIVINKYSYYICAILNS